MTFNHQIPSPPVNFALRIWCKLVSMQKSSFNAQIVSFAQQDLKFHCSVVIVVTIKPPPCVRKGKHLLGGCVGGLPGFCAPWGLLVAWVFGSSLPASDRWGAIHYTHLCHMHTHSFARSHACYAVDVSSCGFGPSVSTVALYVLAAGVVAACAFLLVCLQVLLVVLLLYSPSSPVRLHIHCLAKKRRKWVGPPLPLIVSCVLCGIIWTSSWNVPRLISILSDISFSPRSWINDGRVGPLR